MIIRSKAPLRISFCGGGTEVEPYLSERGGVVLSTTIDRYAYGTLRFRDDDQITVNSLDYDLEASYRIGEPLKYDGQLDLIKAVISRLYRGGMSQGLDFYLHCDAPPGSGLGSSSTMVVTMIGLFKHWLHLPLTDYQLADLAYQIERVDLGIKGGKQDQYAATFGGFNFIEFYRDATIVNSLRIPNDTLNELHYNLLLCYTGKIRASVHIIDTQVAGYVDRKASVLDAMSELKAITIDLKNALLQGRLKDFGMLLHDAWENKKKMAGQISDPEIDELYAVARKNGALGGKITGAGGGGYMFFYCEFDKKVRLAEKIKACGASVAPFNFATGGLQNWEVN